MKSKFCGSAKFLLSVILLTSFASKKVFADESWTQEFMYPFDTTLSTSNINALERSYAGHNGVDYAVGYYTPVYASMDGYVLGAPTTSIALNTQNPPVTPDANNCVGYGNTIVIRNEQIGCSIRYAHLAPGTITLEQNDPVEAGDLIGYTGNTGNSVRRGKCGLGIGYHLHYEVVCDTESDPCPANASTGLYNHERFNPYNGKNFCDDALYPYTSTTSNTYVYNTSDLGLDEVTNVPANQTDQDNSLFTITGSDTFIFPAHDDDDSEDFEYDDNAYRCASTIYGGEETDWDYYCTPKEGNEYNLGETFRALYKIEDIYEDHYFKAEFKTESGIVVQEDVTDTNEVSGYWEHAYFWPTARFYFPGLYYLQAYVVIQPTSGPEEEYELGGPISFVMNHPFCPFWEACFSSSGGECSKSCPCYEGEGECASDEECVIGAKCIDDECTYDWSEEDSPFDYDGNGYTCHGPVTGGQETNWVYTCENPDSVFNAGDDLFLLLRLDNISEDHRYQVKAYKDENYQFGWSTNWNDVGEWGWNYGYFMMETNDIQHGDWEFEVYVDVGEGFPATPVDTVAATVLGDDFYYDGNAVSCHEVTGGQETGWIYTCENQTNIFEEGDDVFGFLELNDIFEDYRVHVDMYHNDVWAWGWSTGWTDVGGYWERTYFWAEQEDATPGSWAFKIYVDTGSGFPSEPLDVIEFFVNEATTPPYTYDGNGAACTGPISGGEATNWVYTCENERYNYLIHQDVHTLIHVDDVAEDVQFKVVAYKNGSQEWAHEDSWIDVGQYGWDHAYFWPVLYDAEFGEWQFKIYIRSSSNMSYNLLRNIGFTVR